MIEQMQGDEMLTRKIELILEMNSKKLITEVTQLRSELQSVKSMLEVVQRQRSEPQQVTSVQRASQPQEVPSQPHIQPSAPARTVEKPIDRNNVSPASVSIEKIFYYGNK